MGRGRPRTSWTSNIKEWKGKNYIEAVRLTSNKYDWRIIALNALQEDATWWWSHLASFTIHVLKHSGGRGVLAIYSIHLPIHSVELASVPFVGGCHSLPVCRSPNLLGMYLPKRVTPVTASISINIERSRSREMWTKSVITTQNLS